MAFSVPEGFRRPSRTGGFDELIGPLYIKRTDDGYVCGFLAEPRHANVRGVVHGGMLISLADQTLGMNVFRAVDRQPCATISLNTDFLAGAQVGDWIECAGRVTRTTRFLVFISGELRAGERLIGTATGIWKRLATRSGGAEPTAA